MNTMDIKENYEALYNMHLPIQPPPFYYPLDPMAQYGMPSCYAMEINGARRKNATRETTSTLKAWLNEHRKNPYPTKGEKIMLAICTKMTLTQVSTWFANARRRLKKENKMTWSPRNRCDDDDDFIDDEPLANSANDKCSSRSASVSSVQQQNTMLQIKNDQHNQANNQHSSSSATNLNNNNLNDVPHPAVPFGLPNLPNGLSNGLSNLPNGLSNSNTLAQQQLAAAIAAANQLPPQIAAQLSSQQLLLGNADANSMAAFMQQQLAALHHQQIQQLNNNLNNNIKKIEEDSTEIVDIEDNSNLGSLSDSDSINQSSALHQQQLSQLAGLSNHHHHNNHQMNNHHHKHTQPPTSISQSAASLLHHSQNSSLNHLSNLHSQLAAAAASLNPFNAASAAAALAASQLSNALSPMSKSTQANLHKPKIWSIVDIATNSSGVNLLDSSHLSKDNVKSEKKHDNSSALKVPSSINQPPTGISISSPSTTSVPTTLTNTTSTVKKE